MMFINRRLSSHNVQPSQSEIVKMKLGLIVSFYFFFLPFKVNLYIFSHYALAGRRV